MEKRLRICICSTFYPPYGSDADAVYLQGLAEALSNNGHEVTVVFNPTAGKILNGNPGNGFKGNSNVRLHEVPSRLGMAGLLALHQTGRPVFPGSGRRLFPSEHFDVIHYHNVSLMGGPGIFARGNAAVKICGINDHWLVCPTHILWRWTEEVCHEPRCFRCSVRHAKPPQLWRSTQLMQRMARNIDAFLAPSLFTIHAHRERGFDNPMVHLPGFHSKPIPKSFDVPKLRSPFFLCAGRLEKYKGFQQVIPLFRNLPDHDLVITGKGGYLKKLETLSSDLPNVHIIGPVTRSELQFLYRNAVATIVPSLCYQTFCHTTIESYSEGTPVIAYSQGAVKEIVETHGGGILYTDKTELFRAIGAVVSDPGLRDRLSNDAQKAYSEQFSDEVYLSRYIDIIHTMISLKKNGSPIRALDEKVGEICGQSVFGV